MKTLILSVTVLLSIITISCGSDSRTTPNNHCGSYEFGPIAKDTINLIDANCKKQGKWIIKNAAGEKDTVYYKDDVAQ